MKVSILLLDIVRVPLRVANLASDYSCSNPCSFRDMTFFLWISPNFSKKLKYKKFQKFVDLNPVIGICEGTIRGLQILPLNMAAQIVVVFEI